jgi:glycosyltransferase involved in cell wall biosynthesis
MGGASDFTGASSYEQERKSYAIFRTFARSYRMAQTEPGATRGWRFLNVASSVDPAAGGISESILRLSRALIELGHEVETVSVDDPQSPWAAQLAVPVHLKGPARGPLEHSRDFAQWLPANAGRFDAILSHGLWRYNSRAARHVARAAGKPCFVFPHGMLDPWFKRYYPMKHVQKCVYWWLGEYAVLRDAAAVLFTCDEERRLARKSFWPYRCTERVVPLGTSEPPGDATEQKLVFAETFPELKGKRVLLFLGRLHEKKGCDLLLRAFLDLLQHQPRAVWENLHLMLAGPSHHPEYLAKLRVIAAQCEAVAPGSVSFPGMLTGDLKWGALRRAEAFILPSHQENFGIAVVEALACGTPVLISRPVNIWREIEAAGVGLVDEDTDAGCHALVRRWLDMSLEEKEAMRARTVTCFYANFEITRTAHSLLETVAPFMPGGVRAEAPVTP